MDRGQTDVVLSKNIHDIMDQRIVWLTTGSMNGIKIATVRRIINTLYFPNEKGFDPYIHNCTTALTQGTMSSTAKARAFSSLPLNTYRRGSNKKVSIIFGNSFHGLRGQWHVMYLRKNVQFDGVLSSSHIWVKFNILVLFSES